MISRLLATLVIAGTFGVLSYSIYATIKDINCRHDRTDAYMVLLATVKAQEAACDSLSGEESYKCILQVSSDLDTSEKLIDDTLSRNGCGK